MARKKKVIELKPGLKFRGWDRDLWHVLSNFTDDGAEFWVVKSWAKYKQRWVYEVKSRSFMEWWLEHEESEVGEYVKSVRCDRGAGDPKKK